MTPYIRPKQFDNNLIVIGGGSAGLIAALIASTVKAKVTLIERDRMGGDCLNTGCVPSKTLIRSASIAQNIREAGLYGLADTEVRIEFGAVMRRVHGAIKTIEPHDSVERFTELGVNCIQGNARLLDPWTVKISTPGGEETVTGRNIVLASGAQPLVPPIPGLSDVEALTSDNLWQLEELPERLVVMGAGPIGCELAQSFQRLGSRVTLVDMAERILPREDPDVSEILHQRLSEEGINILTGQLARSVNASSKCLLTEASSGADGHEIPFDEILVALGRKAHTAGMGLETLGIEVNANGTVSVDRFMRTAQPNIFACGDVAGPYQFTHMASHQAWYAAVNALFGRLKKFAVNYRVVPWATYTDPEVARVGLSEEEAKEQGIAVEITRFPLSELDRAVTESQTTGFIKVLTVPGKDRILGAVIVAPHAGELISEYVMAMTHKIGLKKIMGTIHIYPTYAELNKFAASQWRKNHAPNWAMPWLERFHRLLRNNR